MRRAALVLSWLCLGLSAFAQRIVVSGDRFEVGGKPVWLNGANAPWHAWNDFGTGRYDNAWWESQFQSLAMAHVNAVRIWISCTGGGLRIEDDGTVTGVTPSFFSDLDRLFAIARRHRIYVLVTAMSYDFCNRGDSPKYRAWRRCFSDPSKVATLAGNYLAPLASRYRDNPYFFAVDLCNEPEWCNQNRVEGSLAWTKLQYLVGALASAVHTASGGSVLATVGSASIKWNADRPAGSRNLWKDAALQAQVRAAGARLDFYETHWYGWNVRWSGDPASQVTPATFGVDDRPNIIGECPASGMKTQDARGNTVAAETPADTYEGCREHGWQGVFAWSSNGVDGNGSLADFSAATTAFRNRHPDLAIDSRWTSAPSPPMISRP